MKQKLLILLGVVVFAGSLIALLLHLASMEPVELTDRETRVGSPTTSRSDPRPTAATPEEPAEENGALAGSPTPAVEGDAPLGYTRSLCGVSGRVVEEDGTPVRDLPVTLMELDFEVLRTPGAALSTAPGPVELEVDTVLTDEEGRFVLSGARSRTLHALAVDLAGPRATLRVLDLGFESGRSVDVGDIILASGAELVGRVVDEAGAPVFGARVRATVLPALIFQTGVQHVRPESRIALMSGEECSILELPSWAMAYVNRLPIPTAYTEQDGRFRIGQVPGDPVSVLVDRPGFVTTTRGPIPLAADRERDLGVLTLHPGSTLSVRVVDAAGLPVGGVEVVGGRLGALGGFAMMQPAVETDEPGRYEIPHLPWLGPALFAARRHPAGPWCVVGPRYEEGEAQIQLAESLPLSVYLVDESDVPVPGARLRIRPFSLLRNMGPAGFFSSPPVEPPTEKIEEGHYEVAGLAPGHYELVVHAPGYASASERIELSPESTRAVVVLRAGREHLVSVIDAATDEPVEWATVSVHGGGLGLPLLDSKRTDREGLVTLGPVPSGPVGEDDSPAGLLVEHPGYAQLHETLDVEGSPQVVRLRQGGRLAGVVHADGAPPGESYMIVVDMRSRDVDLPRFGVSDPSGRFAFSGLEAGGYSYEVVRRFLSADVSSLLARSLTGSRLETRLARGAFEIEEGKTTELSIDVDPGPTGEVIGWVRANGAEAVGFRVSTSGRSATRRDALTDDEGRFDLGALPAGKVWLSVDGPLGDGVERTRGLYRKEIEVPVGRVVEVPVDLLTSRLTVRVADLVTRKGVPGAVVHVLGSEAENRGQTISTPTGPGGDVAVTLSRSGAFVILAEHARHGRARARVQIDETHPGEERIELFLEPTVPCRGRIELDATLVSDTAGVRSVRLRIDPRDAAGNEPSAESAWIGGNDLRFRFEGLIPGDYRARARTSIGSGTVEFTLPPGGATDLVLRFTRSSDPPSRLEIRAGR